MFKQIIHSVLVLSVILSVTPSITYARDAAGGPSGDASGGDGGDGGEGDTHASDDSSRSDSGRGRGRDAGRNTPNNPFPPLPRIALTFCDRAISGNSNCIDERL